MPEVNLSTMSAPELRRLLDATRARGEATLSYQILQEMAARRERGRRRGLFLMRRPAEPRVIAVDLGEPMEPEDDLPPMPPAWRGLPPIEPEASTSPLPAPALQPSPGPALGPALGRSRRRKTQPAPSVATAEPAAVVDAEPEPPEDEAADAEDAGLRFPGREGPRARRRLPLGTVAAFAAAAAMGITLGWWVGGITHHARTPPTAPAAAPMRTAALAPRPAPAPAPAAPIAAEPDPAIEASPGPAAGPPPDLREGALSPPNAAEAARDADSQAAEPPPPASRKAEPVRTTETPQTAVVRTAPTGAKACAAAPTPADREICGDPELRRLQRELRQAYAKALEAHQDRALLRQRQLAWRNDRNTVSDPHRLARLYEQRIRKLNAATAEARQQR